MQSATRADTKQTGTSASFTDTRVRASASRRLALGLCKPPAVALCCMFTIHCYPHATRTQRTHDYMRSLYAQVTQANLMCVCVVCLRFICVPLGVVVHIRCENIRHRTTQTSLWPRGRGRSTDTRYGSLCLRARVRMCRHLINMRPSRAI